MADITVTDTAPNHNFGAICDRPINTGLIVVMYRKNTNPRSLIQWINSAKRSLSQLHKPSPELDAEILATHALGVSRSYIYSHPERMLEDKEIQVLSALLERRLSGEPIAYILGEKEFWSLTFKVNQHTLIPRPETELLVEQVLKLPKEPTLKVADLGTGSGAIAIAIAKERPTWQITATDQSSEALKMAEMNKEILSAGNVAFYQGDWCNALLAYDYDIIISNPPYISENDAHLTETDIRFEPKTALVSGKDGLKDLREIIFGAIKYLKPEGQLLLEHGYNQSRLVKQFMQEAGFKAMMTHKDLSGIERVTLCKKPTNDSHN